MNRLFANVYLDENIRVLVADLLEAGGIRAVTTRDENRLGESDDSQLRFAADTQMALLTHNRGDFEEPRGF